MIGRAPVLNKKYLKDAEIRQEQQRVGARTQLVTQLDTIGHSGAGV
jgi:hypothetical protein